MSPYDGKIVLITGASAGIGKATALYLAKKQVKALTLFARGKEALDEVAKEIEDLSTGTKVAVVTGDASVEDDNKRAVEETVKTFGGINGAFLNAGIYRGGKQLHEVEDKDVDDLLNVNIKSVIYGFRHLVPAIRKTVGESGPTGSIVVNSSCMGYAVISPKSAGSAAYSASKAFVNSLVETAAIENAPRIRVNCVMPGVIKTNIMPVDDDTYQAIASQMQPLWGRPGSPMEVASLASYLLGDESSIISGTCIKADALWSLSGSG